jgi:hypothetical protein
MEILEIDALNGINEEVQPIIYEAMETCSNAQRLCVCLYFMSDLPDYNHSLDRIEENLSKIFPPSIPHGNVPDTYKDFAATAIRQYFNYETGSVRNREIPAGERLWYNPQRGHWRNTDLGNSYALRVLQERDIAIKKRGKLQEPTVPFIDYSSRRYLDESKTSESLQAKHQASPYVPSKTENEQSIVSNPIERHLDSAEVLEEGELLSKVLQLLSYLSNNPPASFTETHSTTLNMKGSPPLIYQLLIGQSKSHIGIVAFNLSRQSDSWQVDIVLTS